MKTPLLYSIRIKGSKAIHRHVSGVILVVLVVGLYLVYSFLLPLWEERAFMDQPIPSPAYLPTLSPPPPPPSPKPVPAQPKQHRPAEVEGVDCIKMLNGNTSYLNNYRKRRITLTKEPLELDMSCEAITARWNFSQYPRDVRVNDGTYGGSKHKRMDAEELERSFPLAFARTVFRDYLLVEQMLSVEYVPWNYYCYSLDSKAEPIFKRRLRAMASCFPNVVVAAQEYAVYSNGKNVSRSHLICLEELLNIADDWKYVILLQNHDIPHKTNHEKVRILIEFAGANDIATNKMRPERIKSALDWSLIGLDLYKNATLGQLNQDSFIGGNKGSQLYHTKSLNLVALTHAAAEFVAGELNLTTYIRQLERGKYGMDEALFSTLNANLPDFPGGFTTRCLQKEKKGVGNMGRYVVWGADAHKCHTKKFRHTVCLFGAEDLASLAARRNGALVVPHLYLNKILPSFDYGAAFCWLNWVAERKERHDDKALLDLDLNFYRNLPHVRYNRLRTEGKLDTFEC